jgi:hypothetical protein
MLGGPVCLRRITMPNQGDSKPQGTKILGAVAAVVALVALLLWGASQSSTEEASVITESEKPSAAAYESEAQQLEYEAARLGDYDRGTKVVFEATIVAVLEEAELGARNAVVNVRTEAAAGAETMKQEQVLLVFTSDQRLEEHADVEVQGRYIGSGEYESPLGSTEEIPAFQVDYMNTTS